MRSQDVEVTQGRIRVREAGEGPPVVLLHGALVDGRLWDGVVERLSSSARCVVPDLPLGSHRVAMRPDADLTPPGLARLVAELLERLDLDDVTLVGNDTGGAIAQIVAANHPERLGRLVLTPCDAFDNFLPKAFRPLQLIGAHVPGALKVAGEALRLRALRDSPLGYGLLVERPIDPALSDSWLAPGRADAGVRRDARKLLAGIDKRHTLAAVERLKSFDKPALIAWAPEDRVFPFEHAERLAAILPNARLERIEHARTFVPLDAPERVAGLLADAVRPVEARSG